MMNDTTKKDIEQGKWEKQCKHLKRLLLAYKLRVVDLSKQNFALSKQNSVLCRENSTRKGKNKSPTFTPRSCLEQQDGIIRIDAIGSGGNVKPTKEVKLSPNAKVNSKRIQIKEGKVSQSLTGVKHNNDLDLARKWRWTMSELENNKDELASYKQKLKEKEKAVQLYVSGLARLNSIIDEKDRIIQNVRKENAEFRNYVADCRCQ